VVDDLRDHYAAGRLSEDELAARIDDAYRAATHQELEVLTLDLPGDGVAPVHARRVVTPGGRALRTSVRIHLALYVLVNVLLVAIWAASGGGYFWPIWPMLGWGIGVAGHAAPVLAGVGTRRPGEHRRRLAPQEVPRLAAPDGTVTILFSDIAGSTEFNDRLGDIRWLELLREHHAVIREQVRACGGFEVKAQGDGFMIAFPSARGAIRCALGIQDAMEARLGAHPDGPLRVRIGLHSGEVLREGDDFYGRNVVVAARIAEQAAPGEILVSAIVKQLTESAGDLRFEPEREAELKGLGLQALYRVSAHPSSR
jgi:class 3 adenylate cyclase